MSAAAPSEQEPDPSVDTGLLQRARSIAVETIGRYADDVDASARFPREAFDALRSHRLLGAAVPASLGGGGAGLVLLARICETLGRQCASSAMIYAMHSIQVACLARHRRSSAFFAGYLRDVAKEQSIIASATSEVGVGGEIRASAAAVVHRGGRVSLVKQATTVSYGATADAVLITARRALDAPPSDQVIMLLRKQDYTLEPTGKWDTLGMRGTCSPGYRITGEAAEDQILPVCFAEVASQTMVPFSHVLWSSCWLGIATAAVTRARAFVRQQARMKPGVTPPGATRLASAWSLLQLMRNNVFDVATECDALMADGDTPEALSSLAFALKLNNLKMASSELVVEIVHEALRICGVAGYRNDSSFSLGRHLRDGCSAALMVSNERIVASNASMLLVLKDD